MHAVGAELCVHVSSFLYAVLPARPRMHERQGIDGFTRQVRESGYRLSLSDAANAARPHAVLSSSICLVQRSMKPSSADSTSSSVSSNASSQRNAPLTPDATAAAVAMSVSFEGTTSVSTLPSGSHHTDGSTRSSEPAAYAKTHTALAPTVRGGGDASCQAERESCSDGVEKTKELKKRCGAKKESSRQF